MERVALVFPSGLHRLAVTIPSISTWSVIRATRHTGSFDFGWEEQTRSGRELWESPIKSVYEACDVFTAVLTGVSRGHGSLNIDATGP